MILIVIFFVGWAPATAIPNFIPVTAPSYLILIFTRLNLCLADAIHNFKGVNIMRTWQNHFYILLIDITFNVWKLVFNVLRKHTNVIVTGGLSDTIRLKS